MSRLLTVCNSNSCKFMALVIYVCLFSACVHLPQTRSGDPQGFSPDFEKSQYAEAIEEQSRIVVIEADRVKRAEAYFHLALLYASYKNPDQSYRTAYLYVEKAIKTEALMAERFEVQNLQKMLFDLNFMSAKLAESNKKMRADRKKIAKLKAEIRRKQKSADDLQKENKLLRQMNSELKISMNRLKDLDIEIEKKRKSLR